MEKTLADDLFNKGLYTVKDLSQLLGLSSQKVSRWLFGSSNSEGLYEPNLADYNKIATFQELIELKAIKSFLDQGISLQKMRKIKEALITINDTPYPFSYLELYTDGKYIFLQDKGDLLEPLGGQLQFENIIRQSLKDVDFEIKKPVRWWIEGQDKGILVDPTRSFGKPIDNITGIPTSVLYRAWKVNDESEEIVADDFFIAPEVVRRACEFETSLRA